MIAFVPIMSDTNTIMHRALAAKTVVPAFNIPYLPMMEPVVRALRDCRAFGLIGVARLEWEKFESGSPRHIRDEYERVKDEEHTRLHLDHVPVIDEDFRRVDYMAVLTEAVELGYDSVMVDGSRLSLEDNIEATRQVVKMAHARDVPVEAELGAVPGHETGPLPPYEELFASGKGFTDVTEAKRFVEETGVDWLSVSIGNIHGAVTAAARTDKKVAARLHLERLAEIRAATGVPIVLHGGSGIQQQCILDGIRNGIAKINIGTTIRQAYESATDTSIEAAREAVYTATCDLVTNEFKVSGLVDKLLKG